MLFVSLAACAPVTRHRTPELPVDFVAGFELINTTSFDNTSFMLRRLDVLDISSSVKKIPSYVLLMHHTGCALTSCDI